MDTTALLISTLSARRNAIESALGEAGWTVEAFGDPRAALERLRAQPYGAVFCDDQLRGASASGFLAWSRRLAPERPFYLFGDAERVGAAGDGPDAVLRFPPVSGDLPRPAGTDPGSGAAEGERGHVPMQGNTSLVALTDLLDMMGIASQSATVELGPGRGRVFVDGGLLVHAEHLAEDGPQRGLPALAELIQIEDCAFRVLPYERPPRPSVNLATTTAITEAARLADERQRYQRILRRLHQLCPDIDAAAAGYPLSASPAAGFGQADAVFAVARGVLEGLRGPLDGRPVETFVRTGTRAYAVVGFGEDNIVIARAPAAKSVALFNAVKRALADGS